MSSPELSKLIDNSHRALSVIAALKANFARHGIPEEVRSDNGSLFDSEKFSSLGKSNRFCHRTFHKAMDSWKDRFGDKASS